MKPSWKTTLCLALLAAGLNLSIVRSAAAQSGQVQYVYDDAGRLVAVIDPTGEAAVYHYDAVGNLLSIARESSSTTVKIVYFSPGIGPIGATVIISGTGFSAVASENSVTFNGTAATVASSTATQIVTTVPPGATSGLIAVTTTLGSATSDTAFTVTTSAAAPTITNFSPVIGTASTTVTVNGANFDPTVANNKVRFGKVLAGINTVTTTTISTAVPSGAGTGHINVSTPAGAGASAGHFFVPPGTYTAADVIATQDMAFGDTRTIAVNTSGKIALAAFDATAGQHVSLQLSAVTISSSFVTVSSPSGATVWSSTVGTSGAFSDWFVPQDGTYMVTVDPDSTDTGAMTAALNAVNDVTGMITAGGPSVTVTTTAPGQNGYLTFSGTAGERISLAFTSTTMWGCQVGVNVLKPDGTVFQGNTCMGGNSFFDTATLPVTGTYTILIDPSGTITGSITATLYNVPADVTGTITAGGPAVTITATTPGQNAYLTFSGTAGERISLAFTSTSMWGCQVGVNVLKPDGTVFEGNTCMGGNSFFDTATLPVAGTYTIAIDPSGTVTGSTTATLYDVPADVTGTITAGGASVTTTITTPGQNAHLTFSGTAGERISLALSSTTMWGCQVGVNVLKPDGTVFEGNTCMGGNSFFDTATLPLTGTYTIVIDPSGTITGNIATTLYDVPVDASASIAIGNPPATVTTTVPGQNAQVTFAGTAGQQATVYFTNSNLGSTDIRLLNPDGSQLASMSSGGANFNLSTQTLPATGTYTITINPSGAAVGSISVNVTTP